MWTPTALLLVLAACVSAEYGFKVGTQYKYEVNSRTLTSLQQVSQQFAGVFIRAQLTISPAKEDELICVITQPEKAQVHTTFSEGVEFDVPVESLKYTPFILSKEPFIIKLRDGVVDELVVSKDLPIWEVNVIRSIVSQFKVDTQGKRIITPGRLNTITRGSETTTVYKVMEDTVEGECEVQYDINPLPKYVIQRMPYLAPQYQYEVKEELINIMKTKNFSNCQQRPGYHFGLTGLTDWEPTTNKMGNFLSRSSVTRVVISGNLQTYTMHSSVTTNKVIVSPELYNNQKGEVISRMNVTLIAVESGSQNAQTPQNPQTLTKLVYDFNSPFTSDSEAREKWNTRTEQTGYKSTGSILLDQIRNKRWVDDKTMILSNEGRYQELPKMTQAPETPFLPYFVGYNGHSIQHSKEINVNQVVRKLAEQIGHQTQDQTQISKENVLERFSLLTEVMRTMNVKQLEQTVQEIYTGEEETSQSVSDSKRNTWMAFRDALAQAGTGPALVTIVNLITSHKIKGEEAAEVVSTFPETVRYPTTEYLNTFFELVKNPEVVSQTHVNGSCIYAFTKLVRMALVNKKTAHNRYPVHAFGYLTPRDDVTVVETYIPYFAQQLEQAAREKDSHKIQTYIRALGNIAHPKILQVFEPYLEGQKPMTDFQRTLVVVSLNKMTTIYPKLARSVLYKIYSNVGEVYQVRVAAVYNLMKTNPPENMLQRMAQFTHEDPSYQVRSAVKTAIESAALLNTKTNFPLRQNAQSAVNMLVPTVYGVQYSSSNLTDYLVKGLHLEYTQNLKYIGSEDSLIPKSIFYKVIGNKNGFQNTILKVSGMISTVHGLRDFLQDIFYTEEQMTGEPETKDQTFNLEKIYKTLNVEHVMKEQVEGNIFFKYGTMQRFFAFDNHTIESLPHIINKLSQILAKGKVYNYQKMFSEYEVTVALPTATGFPFVYTLETPIYFGLKGKVQAEIPEIKARKGSNFAITAKWSVNADITCGKTAQGKIGFVTPFDSQRYTAGYNRQTQVNLPIRGSLTVDTKTRQVHVEFKPVDKRVDYKLFHYHSKPYTCIQNVVDFKPSLECNTCKVITTVPLKETTHFYGGNYLGMIARLHVRTEKRNTDLKKVIYEWYKRHDFTSGFLFPASEIAIDNTEVELFYDTKMSTAQTVSLTATYRQIKSMEYQQETTEKTFTPSHNDQSRIEEFYKKASSGIKGAIVSVVDLGLKVQGGTPIQYVGTIAFARSPIDAPTKVLAYLHRTMGGENYEVCFNGKATDSYLSAVDYEKVLKAEPHSDIAAQLRFGNSCESGAKVDITGRMERSRERREYLEKLPQVQNCRKEMQHGNKMLSACKNATMAAGLMDKYRFTVQYHGVNDEIKNMTYQVYSVLRHFGYPYVSESISTHGQQTQNQQVELDVNFTPDLHTANVYVSAPVGIAQFRNIHVNKYVRSVLIAHPVYDVVKRWQWTTFRQQFDACCTIDRAHAKTFDNQTYPARLENVWHVMAITVPRVDNQGKYKTLYDFSVLVREDSSNRKEIQLIFDYPTNIVARVVPSESSTPCGKVFVNEKPVQFNDKGFYEYHDQSGKTVFQVYAMPTGEVKIVHPEHQVELVYDQTVVQLALGQEYRNRVGGLCGVYNGEQFDFVTPKGFILRNPEEFVSTWALSTEGHVGELKKKAQEHSLYKKVKVLTNVIGEEDKVDTYGKYNDDGLTQDYELLTFGPEETEGQCTIKRIMVVERDGKHCFSTHPVTACKPGCQAEKTTTMTGEFICVNKTQTSSHWAQMVARGAQPNFKNKGNAQKMQFEGAEVCTKA